MKRRRQQLPWVADGRLFWIDDFLSPEMCENIRKELRFAFWYPSSVYRKTAKQHFRIVQSKMRISLSTNEIWFTPQLQRMVRAIDRKLHLLMPGITQRREHWQATQYAKGGRFGYHLDSGSWAHEPPGERVYTVLLYLKTPRKGGGTRFAHLDIEIKALAGRLLIWKNLTDRAKSDPEMLHSSVPVRNGSKIVLVTWIRQRRTTKKSE